jgi:hypothetical protein
MQNNIEQLAQDILNEPVRASREIASSLSQRTADFAPSDEINKASYRSIIVGAKTAFLGIIKSSVLSDSQKIELLIEIEEEYVIKIKSVFGTK